MSDENVNEASAGQRNVAGELRDEFYHLASDLDRHTRNVNIARVVGGAVGVLGAAASLMGFGRGVVGDLGGMTVAGAQLVKASIEKHKLKKAATKWSVYCKDLPEGPSQGPDMLLKSDEDLAKRIILLLYIGIKTYKDLVAKNTTKSADAGDPTSRIGNVGGGRRSEEFRTQYMSFMIDGITSWPWTLNLFLMLFNLYHLGCGADEIMLSMDINSTAGSQAALNLRKLAQSLDEFANTGQWPH